MPHRWFRYNRITMFAMPASTPKVVVSALVLVYAQTFVNLRYASSDSDRIYELINELLDQEPELRRALSLTASALVLLWTLAAILRYRDFMSVLLVYLYQTIFIESLLVLFVLEGLGLALILTLLCYLPAGICLGWWKVRKRRGHNSFIPPT